MTLTFIGCLSNILYLHTVYRNISQSKMLHGSQSDINSRFTESIGNLMASSQATSMYRLDEEDGDDLNLDEELFEHNKMEVVEQIVFENGSIADITEHELAELNNMLDHHDQTSETDNEDEQIAATSSLTTTPTQSKTSLEVTSSSESEGEENEHFKRKHRPSYVFAGGMINPTKSQLKQLRQRKDIVEERDKTVSQHTNSNRELSGKEESKDFKEKEVEKEVKAEGEKEESKDFTEEGIESKENLLDNKNEIKSSEEKEETFSRELTAEEIREEEEKLASLEMHIAEMEELEKRVEKVQNIERLSDVSSGGGSSISDLSSQVSEDEFDDLINSLSHVAKIRQKFQGKKSPTN